MVVHTPDVQRKNAIYKNVKILDLQSYWCYTSTDKYLSEQNMETENKKPRDPYAKSRVLYIIEAALEYFISILVGSAYLAKLTTSLGISDGLCGVLTAFISLGSGFQIFALFLAGSRRTKRIVVPIHLINELCFTFLYVIPVIDISGEVKIAVFVCLLLVGQILHNVINSPKINWLMSLVDDGKRGSFTAKKEIVSLISGMAVSLIMGGVIDGLEAKGELKLAFIIGGITLAALTVLHAVTLIMTRERTDTAESPRIPVTKVVKNAFSDKSIRYLIPFFALWSIASYVTTPFYGTYQINDLGFSMTEVAILSAAYAIVRSLVSMPIGRLSDKYSFAATVGACLTLMIVAYFINCFAGKVFFIIYYLLYAVAMAGINSGTINLIYDYTKKENRTGALAIKNTVCGFIGFYATLATRPLVEAIQANGNAFLGTRGIYAQQVLSFIGMLITSLSAVYLAVITKKLKRC